MKTICKARNLVSRNSCDRPGSEVVGSCVHEHVNRGAMCDAHLRMAQLEAVFCRECREAGYLEKVDVRPLEVRLTS